MEERKMDLWIERFIRDSKLKGSIILSGNSSDIIRNRKTGKYEYISNYIIKLLNEESKFNDIIKWDRVDGIDYNVSKISNLTFGNIQNNNNSNKSPNVEDYLNDDDLKEINNNSSNNKFEKIEDFFPHIHQQIRSKTNNKICFIIDYSDYIFGTNASLSENERNWLTIIGKALRESMNYDMFDNDFKEQKRSIIIITNKLSTIPSSYYLNNPDVSCINIPSPGRPERESFILNNESLINLDPPLDENRRNDFIDSLEGFKLKDIAQIMKLSMQTEPKLSADKIINLYKYGEKKSPWEDLSKNKLANIEKTLAKRVKGQDEAIEKVKDVIIRAFTGFSGIQHSTKQRKPKGVLFFVGPTGVGKTELAKSLAEFLFLDETACIRFDMSEFNHEHSDQRLVGAPPGYVGYEEGGQLTNAIKEKPFSVLLFDEIEKAHGRILDKFLQILEDGRLTDGKGETVSFSESVIIFTSNIGASQIDYSNDKKQVYQQFLEHVKKHFVEELKRPELLNRVGDNIVPFNFIDSADFLNNIARVKFESIEKFIEEKYKSKIKFENEESSYSAISNSVDIKNGGRGVLNVLESKIINPLSNFVFENIDSLQGRTIKIVQLNPKRADFEFELE
ncbi:AAA family ATPase [Brachyspira hampsonii]|uniref:AAA family ATPase n=1 Tax=Brachyspira hampsonii TaxID=1287055 RepID=UPI000D3AF58C|nr:AAA family ATPase [Brachyspira hampsonii]PTY39403.1 peptidase S14 [Brachyspira hampsonii bv. II]